MKANILKAVSDPTRMGMLESLRRKERCACELPSIVKRSQPAVSLQLQVLREAGLVRVRRDGTKRLYSLSPHGKKVMQDIGEW